MPEAEESGKGIAAVDPAWVQTLSVGVLQGADPGTVPFHWTEAVARTESYSYLGRREYMALLLEVR